MLCSQLMLKKRQKTKTRTTWSSMWTLTLPITGMSTDPQVSAPQCTIPDAKSAVTMPRTVNGQKKKTK